MVDKPIPESIECPAEVLKKAVADYLKSMALNGYAHSVRQKHQDELAPFVAFIKHRRLIWDDTFRLDTLNEFSRERNKACESIVLQRFLRYLIEQHKIRCPLCSKKNQPLPPIYQQYLIYYRQSRRVVSTQIDTAKRVLAALNDYLERSDIKLAGIKIEHIDRFLEKFNASHALTTRRLYRSCLRGFLTYLYQHRGILSKNLAPLVVGPPIFAPQKPPMFLRPHEVKQLLDSLTLSTGKGLRIYAMIHLAYFMGLRPHEISLITLDDISFTKAELTLKNRKNNRQINLPIAENTLKALCAYIIGVRPQSAHRNLFLSIKSPHRPINGHMVSYNLTRCLKKAGLSATAYWLRHTYAQNLLEAGASIYEIKEMLGHDRIDSTRKYLSIHIQLMRKVLFDETI